MPYIMSCHISCHVIPCPISCYNITGNKSATTRTLIGYWTKGACLYNSIMNADVIPDDT